MKLTNSIVNYGCSLHITGDAIYIIPICMQGLPAVLLAVSQFFCNESPRWLARKDRWEDATRVLSTVRCLPRDHPYVAGEMKEIADQLDHERKLIGDATVKTLMREMWLIPGNRKRALISIGLMICQQMTGTNAINYCKFLFHASETLFSVTDPDKMHLKFSRISVLAKASPVYLRPVSTE